MTRFTRALTPIALLAAMLLSTGCASSYGPQTTDVFYYPQCYKPVKQLRQDENYTTKSTVAGAAGGALLGALIGGLATGKVSGALAGAAVGGATGAVGGNIYGKSQQEQRDEAYLRQYSRQLGEETAGMDRVTAAAKVAIQCYDRQFDAAMEDYRSGRINRVQLDDRYSEIRSGLSETSSLLRNASNVMAEKEQEYQRTLAEGFEPGYSEPAPVAQTPKKTTRKTSKATPVASTPTTTFTPAQSWKASKRELDDTNSEVEARMRRYEDNIDTLRG
jgi:hypothetical protein